MRSVPMRGKAGSMVRIATRSVMRYYHAVEAVKELKSIEDTTQESEIRRLGRAVYPRLLE
jgi:hypothetical protein